VLDAGDIGLKILVEALSLSLRCSVGWPEPGVAGAAFGCRDQEAENRGCEELTSEHADTSSAMRRIWGLWRRAGTRENRNEPIEKA
jgi:hypothetical protein